MAASETDFRTELCDALRGAGYHTQVIAQASTMGIVDVYTNGPGFQGWLELKFANAPKKTTTPIKVKLSEHQRKFIRNEHAVGGKAGWILCVRYGREWFYFASSNPEIHEVMMPEYSVRRKAGQPLSFRHLLDLISGAAG